MKSRPRRWMRAAALGLCLAILGGCTTAPSVAPLLRIGAQALRDEARLQEADLVRDLAQLEQSRQTLAAAFDADLDQNRQLTAAWVREATDVYAAAREELVRHELALKQERAQRARNLRLAATAQDRALNLLEQQDRLWLDLLGTDVWSWLPVISESSNNKETR